MARRKNHRQGAIDDSPSVGMEFGSVTLPKADRFLPEPVEVAIELLAQQKVEEDRLSRESQARVSAAVVAVRELMVKAIERDMIHRTEIAARQKGSSMYFSREFQRCTEIEQDEVLSILEGEKIIRVLDSGQIRNLRAKGAVIKVRARRGRQIMYLITNPAMPGWVKGGQSKNPNRRATDMNTGSPSDYAVQHEFELPEGMKDTDMHPYLEKAAGAKSREWFFMPVELAQQVIQLVLVGNEHLIDVLPKCDPPGLQVLVSNNLRAGLALSRKLKARLATNTTEES